MTNLLLILALAAVGVADAVPVRVGTYESWGFDRAEQVELPATRTRVALYFAGEEHEHTVILGSWSRAKRCQRLATSSPAVEATISSHRSRSSRIRRFARTGPRTLSEDLRQADQECRGSLRRRRHSPGGSFHGGCRIAVVCREVSPRPGVADPGKRRGHSAQSSLVRRMVDTRAG